MLIVSALMLLFTTACIESCNEAVCGSRVSKCLLTKACNCDNRTGVCSRNCYNCLGDMYTECCTCVGICPTITDHKDTTSTISHVEDFVESSPELFHVLTENVEGTDHWNVIVYPVEIETKKITFNTNTVDTEAAPTKNFTFNCTVLFWGQCMSWSKCKSSCLTMGASSYRWFHDGCCECVGQNCVNYGIKENRCQFCPEGKSTDNNEDLFEDDDIDYGENDYDD